MAVLTIKTDGQGDPVRAKSRIVVLGNQETTPWSKTDCFAPVISAPVVRLLAALAVRHRTVLKQGDCKNAFCHTTLPDDEVTIVRPPANCPISKPNTFWLLNKTLYGLRRSPQHWFHTLSKYFKEIGLRPTPHDGCLFVGTPVPGKAPIYVALFVDDFVYFSPDSDVEAHFETALASKVKVDFMGQVDYFLGILFDWRRHDDGSVSVHLSQEAYANQIIESMGLLDAVTSPTMTPYRSGLPVDCIPPVDMSDTERAPLLKQYRRFLGMLNWLAVSTRPDLTTIQSLLAIATTQPTQGHLDAIRYAGRYIKATADYGISFSSSANESLESFITFPLDDSDPFAPRPKAFTDSNWGPQDASVPSIKNSRPVSLNETRSISGHLVFMSGGPLLWKSHKEKRTSRSSCEAEVKATDDCTKSVQWLRHILSDLDLLPPCPTPIYNDNQAAVIWSNSSSTKGMRHYNIRENAVREAINEYHEVSVHHIGGKVNPADLLTKEHKSDEIFRTLRDAFMSRRSSGGCWRPGTPGTRASHSRYVSSPESDGPVSV
jgi:hypothetical protein